jgi:hypothetical protein
LDPGVAGGIDRDRAAAAVVAEGRDVDAAADRHGAVQGGQLHVTCFAILRAARQQLAQALQVAAVRVHLDVPAVGIGRDEDA